MVLLLIMIIVGDCVVVDWRVGYDCLADVLLCSLRIVVILFFACLLCVYLFAVGLLWWFACYLFWYFGCGFVLVSV